MFTNATQEARFFQVLESLADLPTEAESIAASEPMSPNGPNIMRPVPRRPFNTLDLQDPDSNPGTPPTNNSGNSLHPHIRNAEDGGNSSASISRASSLMNLTSSTLSGIYEQSEDPETPGARTPVKGGFTLREHNDLTAPELDPEHSAIIRRRLSSTRTPPRDLKIQVRRLKFKSLIVRAVLLFGLGMGYGVLVTTMSDAQEHFKVGEDGFMHPGKDFRYLGFWGAVGVMLGGLLPWFDGVWEYLVGTGAQGVVFGNVEVHQRPRTDWALVVRGIGAFVGIVFAIRRLPWTSSLQASATLALVNPFLWYVIDRSKPGFLLSAAVGLVGSLVLLSLDPQMLPPAGRGASSSSYLNGTDGIFGGESMMLGGLASQETVESGIWMVSVLFCSCVCFGNIGRRLAWHRSAAVKGRWGGQR